MSLTKLSKAKIVATRLASYHRGYLLGLRCGTHKGKSGKPEKKVRVRKAPKKCSVAERLDAYQKGYQLGIQGGVQQVRQQQARSDKQKQSRTPRSGNKSKSCEKHLAEARLDAYLTGVRCGAQKVHSQQAKTESKGSNAKHAGHVAQALKANAATSSSSRIPPIASHLVLAQFGGVAGTVWCSMLRKRGRYVFARKRIWSKSSPEVLQAASMPRKRLWSKSSPENLAANGSTPAAPKMPHAALSPMQGVGDALSPSPIKMAGKRSSSMVACASSRTLPPSEVMQASPIVVIDSPTPMQKGPHASASKAASFSYARGASWCHARSAVRSVARNCSRSFLKDPEGVIDRKRFALLLRGKQYTELHAKGLTEAPQAMQPTSRVTSQGLALVKVQCSETQRRANNALQSFLEDPSGVTTEPSAFQMRCTQVCQVGCNQTCQVVRVVKELVVIISGDCNLCKLNQIISECFNATEHEFVNESTKGETMVGSHFLVSRPLQPGQCSKAIICSSCSVSNTGVGSAFLNDQSYSIAQLFRGKSTGYALEREPAEAAQQIVLKSPLLSADVAVDLDGIMLDSYETCIDSYVPLIGEEQRRSNRQRPLPRIVQSSFLSVAEIEAKNICMHDTLDGPDAALNVDNPWSSSHESYRCLQREPLFWRDGRDFDLSDLNDSSHTGGDEKTDISVDGCSATGAPGIDID